MLVVVVVRIVVATSLRSVPRRRFGDKIEEGLKKDMDERRGKGAMGKASRPGTSASQVR